MNPFLALAQQMQQRTFGASPQPAASAPPVEVQAGWGTFPGHAPVVTARYPQAVSTRANLGGNLGAMNLGQCRCPGAK